MNCRLFVDVRVILLTIHLKRLSRTQHGAPVPPNIIRIWTPRCTCRQLLPCLVWNIYGTALAPRPTIEGRKPLWGRRFYGRKWLDHTTGMESQIRGISRPQLRRRPHTSRRCVVTICRFKGTSIRSLNPLGTLRRMRSLHLTGIQIRHARTYRPRIARQALHG